MKKRTINCHCEQAQASEAILQPCNRNHDRKIASSGFALLAMTLSLLLSVPSYSQVETKHKPASSSTVVNYARNLLLSVVDTNFRSSWVIDPENLNKSQKSIQKIPKSFSNLANVKIGSKLQDVRKILKSPIEIRNDGKNQRIWVYGIKRPDGTYENLTEVFFNHKEEVIGIISFNPKDIVEKIDVKIGDPIDKMISVYGEPVDEKDYIEDPDNKQYLGLYYLYPRSGIGFLIGQDKASSELLVQGVLVFGNS